MVVDNLFVLACYIKNKFVSLIIFSPFGMGLPYRYVL
jgi:hypothetical protein